LRITAENSALEILENFLKSLPERSLVTLIVYDNYVVNMW